MGCQLEKQSHPMSPRPSSSSNDELENQSFKLALFLMNKQMIYVISFVFRTHVALLSRPWVTFCLAVKPKKNSSLIQDDSEFGSWPTLCVDYSMGYESHLWVISNDSSMWITQTGGGPWSLKITDFKFLFRLVTVICTQLQETFSILDLRWWLIIDDSSWMGVFII